MKSTFTGHGKLCCRWKSHMTHIYPQYFTPTEGGPCFEGFIHSTWEMRTICKEKFHLLFARFHFPLSARPCSQCGTGNAGTAIPRSLFFSRLSISATPGNPFRIGPMPFFMFNSDSRMLNQHCRPDLSRQDDTPHLSANEKN